MTGPVDPVVTASTTIGIDDGFDTTMAPVLSTVWSDGWTVSSYSDSGSGTIPTTSFRSAMTSGSWVPVRRSSVQASSRAT